MISIGSKKMSCGCLAKGRLATLNAPPVYFDILKKINTRLCVRQLLLLGLFIQFVFCYKNGRKALGLSHCTGRERKLEMPT